MTTSRSNYLDQIKIVLTVLVILHHAFITYGAPGGWYYKQPIENNALASMLLTMFVATNQSFFMGFFSSYLLTSQKLRWNGRVKRNLCWTG